MRRPSRYSPPAESEIKGDRGRVRGGQVVPAPAPAEDQPERDVGEVVDRPVGVAELVVMRPQPVEQVAVDELVGADHPGVADVDHVGAEDVQPDPQADQEHGRAQQPGGRDGDAQRPAGHPDAEGQQQHPHQQVAEERVDERDRHPDVGVVEEGQREREAEQHQQIDVQQPPARAVGGLAPAAAAAQPGPGDERREEQQAQRQPHVQRVDAAPERARVAAGHPPRHLPAGPHLGDATHGVVDVDLDPLALRPGAREEADLPDAGAVGVHVGPSRGYWRRAAWTRASAWAMASTRPAVSR